MKNKPVAILDQFVEKGRTITYMTAFDGKMDDGRMPNSIAVFKIYLKDKRDFYQKIIKPNEPKRWAWHHLIANQIHPELK